LEKKIVDEIREQKRKEREEKRLRWVEHTFTPSEKLAQRIVEKKDKSLVQQCMVCYNS
jgi:anaerobic ribonucleoside-triphosphate reductase